MDTESLVQPNRKLMFFEKAEELEGSLEVLDRPEVSAGYADIYRGFWITPQGKRVEVAIKELKDPVLNAQDSDERALISRRDTRMKREVFVWSQTTHPNLHPLLGFRSQPRPQLISPWCHHGNLTHYLKKNPGLSRLDKLRLIFQAACGLEHLHAQDPPICHADIKPENVLVNNVLQAALSDFGLSQVLDVFGHHSGFTTSESVKGTYNYIAPELFNEVKPRPTLKTDVYAFGGLILTVMSGKPPFYGLQHPAILYRVIEDQSPRPEDHDSISTSDPLWSLMRRCWDMNPEARPRMAEILNELWVDICKEEIDFWLRHGLAFVLGSDDADSSYTMGIDTSGEAANAEICAMLNLGPVTVRDLMPSIKVAEGKQQKAITNAAFLEARKVLDASELNSGIIRRYSAALNDVGSILLELAQTIDRNDSMANSIGSNALELVGRLELLKEESRTRQGEGIFARVVDVQRVLQCAQANIEDWRSLGLFLSSFSCCDQAEGAKECERNTKRVLEEIRLLVATDIVTELKTRNDQRGLLDRLGDGYNGSRGNTIEEVTCLPGTRVSILEQIDGWIRGKSPSKDALWIRGMAGRGKSTIASTAAHQWKFRGSCAIFHFRRGQDTLNSRLVLALARQLGTSLVPEVKNAVLESIRENEDIATEQLSQQFKTLLVDSLGRLERQTYPILVIVDALDECHDAQYVLEMVKLICAHSSSFPANVKFLLTCRPEAALLRALEPKGWSTVDLDLASEVSNDLSRYIDHAFAQIRNEHDLPEDWPPTGDLSRLVDMSQGLFQWARTAITYVNNGSPIDRLRGLLDRPTTGIGLDDLYHQILSKAMDNLREEPEKQQLLCSVLGTLVVAPHPVSLEVLAALCRDNDILNGREQEDVIRFICKDSLVDLNSLIHIPTSATESVRFMHTSIRDLLVNRERCQDQRYYIDTNQYHRQLAKLSLGLMLRQLTENKFDFSNMSETTSEFQGVADCGIPEALRYCCQAWSIHLTEGLPWSESDKDITKSQVAGFKLFSEKKVLAWIEVMSVIGRTSEAMKMAKQVYHWLWRCGSETFESNWLINLWNDVHRFIAAFSEPISFGGLHIYASALPHCPQNTELWRLYSSSAEVRILGIDGRQMSTWPANLWTKSGDGRLVTVVYSADGSNVLSVSTRGEIQFWDAETGRQVDEKSTGLYYRISSACFSPSGGVLALGCWDNTILLYDVQTGMQLGEPLTGHTSYVISICFSSGGEVLASGSHEMIRLWDSQTGRQLSQLLTFHGWRVESLCFSPDGSVLVSGSGTTVQLWDPRTGRQLGKPLIAHSGVSPLCFSPDSRVLASGGSSRIQLWDPQTGTQLGEPLIGHCGRVLSLCFSPDGRFLASGSSDGTIRLWDLERGTQLREPLTGPNDSISSLCFSSDGRVLVSVSFDETIRLWDLEIGTRLPEKLTGDAGLVDSVCFSPDGRVLATGCYQTIQLWDPQTWRKLGDPLIGHSSSVSSVRFSSDSKTLVSGSCDETILLWDPQTRRQLFEPLTGHTGCVSSVCFSPNDRLLASGSQDETVRIWDPRTGSKLGGPLAGRDGTIMSVCFSPDGKILASGSVDSTIRLWDPETGKELGEPLIGYMGSIQSLYFSPDPDGMFIVAHNSTGKFIVWDAFTREECDPPTPITNYMTIGFKDHWLTLSSSEFLWLPPEYWDTPKRRIVLHGKTLVVAHDYYISIFDLSRLSHALDEPRDS